ncbi:protein mono-ADP-ribosyltransferase PARP14-like isoform X2 [Gouania willdenowi]|uniref:protein mono-ADP-ribosyltransferase PARP14-like isoform X2 n=1 Tax=Gouania willdenowi TaxID=441366 RepID=UPI0010562093|nr:protein mono-ADP-ribosyltransferase PARP14-like isoform X2 [Gouania willdenowi]
MDGLELPPVIVEGDWTPAQVCSVRNKLQLHFQSKKRSNGGECRVELEDGAPRAAVYFKAAEVRDLVLAKKNHEIVLQNQSLKLRLIHPAEGDSYKTSVSSDGAAPPLSSTVLLMEPITPSMDPDLLCMLVESTSGSDESGFNLEVLWESGRALVTFKNPKDAEHMLSLSLSHPKLLKHGLKVEAVEAADSVRVEGLPPHVSTDMLEMHFEKHWTHPLNIKLISDEEAAIVTFSDSKVVESICVKQDHMIRSIPIRIYPYHSSLETALYGAEQPQWKLPAPITDKVHHVIWRYLHKKKLSGSINEQMRPHFCSVDLEEPVAKLRPLPRLLRQKKVTTQLIEAWTEEAHKAFRHVMSQFSMFECLTNETAWKAAENDVRTEVKDDAFLMLDVHRGVLVVGGRADDMKRLKAPVENIVCKAMDHVERLTNATSEGISLTPDWFFILKQEGLQKAANEISPEMKVLYDEDARILTITGLPAEVSNAKVWIFERQMKMCKKQLSFAPCLLDFLRTVDPMDMFKSQGITATFSVEGREVVLVGSSDQALAEAEKKINLALSVQILDVEDQNVLKLKEWGDLNQELLDTYNTAKKTKSVEIQINSERSKVSVAGFMDPVEEVSGLLREFLSDYAHVQECLPLRSLAVTQFIEKKKSQDWINITKDKNVSVNLDKRRPRIFLAGPRLHVNETKSWFIDLINVLFTDTLIVDKPGAKKYFESLGRMFLSTMMTELNCVVLFKSKIQGEEDLDSSMVHTRVQTAGRAVVSVSEANICTFRADAVVNAANETLQHVGGVAQALLRAAGPELQKSSNEYVAKNGQLWPGTAVVTPAFALPCKYVIHAIGPRFSWDQQMTAVKELKAAVMESLKQADLHCCISVALPAISSGIFGFPIDLCAQTIAQAVQEYFGHSQSQGWITEVHLVDNNINTVRVLAEAVNREFGGSGAVMAPQQKVGSGGHKASGGLAQTSEGSGPGPSSHWVSETNLKEAPKPAVIDTERMRFREGKAPGHHGGSVTAAHQTAEGLKVVLCEGNIQDQMSDVIVNTISPNLNLAQGAVSKAILSVAGRGLQDIVRSKVGAGLTPYGNVIVTDGCKLACRKVFHVVCPFWDNQDGQAEEVLVSIVRFCLEEAEKLQMRSLSFPAVGTGNLKFPRDVVSKVLLKEIHSFSRRAAPSYLREVVVIVHPSDRQTMECFTQDFFRCGGSKDIELEELEYEEEEEPDEEVISQSQQASAPSSLVSSPSLGVYQMKIHQLTLEVSSGDITKDSADVIVNSSNPEFTLRTGVSKAILDGAGPTVMMEISEIVRAPNYQQRRMINTTAGNLPSCNIVHVHVPSQPPMIKDAVYSVLKFCEENNFSSVSFPALGTGAGGAKPSEVADAMVGAVVEFEKKRKPQYVQNVKILIFQTSMISEFHQSMMRKQQDVENQSRSLMEKAGAWLKDTFSGILTVSSSYVQKSRTTPVLETEEFEPTVFELCAEDRMSLDEAKRRIEDLIVAEQAERTVSDPFIRLLTQTDWDQLRELQRKLTVSFRLDPEQEDQEPRIHLQGLTRDVFTAESEVRDILRRLERADNQRKKEQQLSRTVQWHYVDRNNQRVIFDPPTNLALEEGKQAKTTLNIMINGVKFGADPVKMKAKSEKGRGNVDLFRTDKAVSALPSHWSPMQGELVKMFSVSGATLEFINVVKELSRTGLSVNIISIERVQNPTLYQSYELMKKQLMQKNNRSDNELLLFHGTKEESIDLINSKGFNRSYAGMHGAMYGNGSYFAVDPDYSARGYARADAKGHKRMYLARVLVGDHTVGKPGLISPPAKSTNMADLYDTVTDNKTPPTMFVVFNDVQAYPEYLITFT